MARAKSTGAEASKNPDPLVEYGATGLKQFAGYIREEFLRDLQGYRGIRMFREMRDNDPLIGGIFFGMEQLTKKVNFSVEPASEDPDDQLAAAFVDSCLTDMEMTWTEFLSDVLTFWQYGWSVHEIVYKFRQGVNEDPRYNSKYEDGMMGWRKFAGRGQETMLHWEFDESGDAVALIQLLPTGGSLLRVPLKKCLHFRTRLIKNNPEGVSILRNAYTSYFYKKRLQEIEAIGIERDLCGLPVAWVPPRLLSKEASSSDKAQLEAFKKMVRDTVRNEQEGFVMPLIYDPKSGNKLYDLTLLSTGGRRQIDISPVVDRYDQRIASSMLAQWILLGAGSQQGRGSNAQSTNQTDMFALAIEGYLDIITGEMNRQAVPDLLRYNELKGSCMVKHGDVTRRDITQFAQYVTSMVGAMVITPDENLESVAREEGGLPPKPGALPNDVNEGGEALAGLGSAGGDTRTAAGGAGEAQGQGGDAYSYYIPGQQVGKRARKVGKLLRERKNR